jgi:hypothetical protein
MCCNLFNKLFVIGHLDCKPFFTIINNAALNILVHKSLCCWWLFPQNRFLEVEYLFCFLTWTIKTIFDWLPIAKISFGFRAEKANHFLWTLRLPEDSFALTELRSESIDLDSFLGQFPIRFDLQNSQCLLPLTSSILCSSFTLSAPLCSSHLQPLTISTQSLETLFYNNSYYLWSCSHVLGNGLNFLCASSPLMLMCLMYLYYFCLHFSHEEIKTLKDKTMCPRSYNWWAV